MKIYKKAVSWGAKAAFNTTLNRNNFKPFSARNQCGTPRNWLPTPFHYYKKIFPGFTSGGEWTNVCCCFHNDRNPSLSINLKSGGFNCFSCGAKGGDLIAFHQQRCNLGFKEAVFQLKKIRREELK
jgi:hypothetical protein